MGEPIKLPDGRTAYGNAQAAAMWADREAIASEPAADPTGPVIIDVDIPTDGDGHLPPHSPQIGGQGGALPALLPPIPASIPVNAASFQGVQGIGPQIEKALYDAGYLTWEDVLQAGVVEIDQRISGIGMNRARALFAMAQRQAK